MNQVTRSGPFAAQPSIDNVERPATGSPATQSDLTSSNAEVEIPTFDLATLTANSAKKAAKRREALLKHVLDSGDRRARIPNLVCFRAEPETMMDARFVDDLLAESQGQPGVFVATEDPGTFEFVLPETLRTEAGELWDQLEKAMQAVDPNRQALVLSGSPIWLTEENGEDRKVRKPYHLVRLRKQRVTVERKGIALSIEAAPAAGVRS